MTKPAKYYKAIALDLGYNIAISIELVRDYVQELSIINKEISKNPNASQLEKNLENSLKFRNNAKEIYNKGIKISQEHFALKRLNNLINELDQEHLILANNYASHYKKWGEK